MKGISISIQMTHHSIFDLQLTNSSQILNSIKSQAEMCAPSQH